MLRRCLAGLDGIDVISCGLCAAVGDEAENESVEERPAEERPAEWVSVVVR